MARRSSASAQLIHASAGPAAPLIHASTGPTAPLTQAHIASASAPMVSGPGGGARAARAAATGGSAPVTGRQGGGKLFVGGTKKNPQWELRDAAGNVLKRYSAQEASNVMKRGAAGGTMGALDQQAYFRATGGESEAEREARLREEAFADRERAAKMQQGLSTEEAKRREAAAIEESKRQEQARSAEFDRRQQILEAQKEQERALEQQREQERIAAENAESEAFNARYGIDKDVRLSKIEREQIATGKMRWGYDPRQEAEIKKEEAFAKEALANFRFNTDDYNRHMEGVAKRRAMMQKGLYRNTEARTAEEIFAGATKGPDGRYYYQDNDGTLKLLGGDEQGRLELEKQKLADQREYRRQEREDARANALEDRRQKWIDSRADKYLAEVLQEGDDGWKEDGDNRRYTYEQALDMARRDAEIRFAQGQPPPSANPPPSPRGTEDERTPGSYNGKSYL